MQKRIFIRTMLDIFLNNAMVKSIASLVNFCKEWQYYRQDELKFLKKMPINRLDDSHSDRYLFSSGKWKVESGK